MPVEQQPARAMLDPEAARQRGQRGRVVQRQATGQCLLGNQPVQRA